MTTRKGMTLIEIMLTLVIVSILTVAAMRVTISISRAHAIEQTQDDDAALRPRINELLGVDVRHAGLWRRTSDGFELRSLASIDYDSLRLAHLPVTVRYETRQIGGLSWLVRTQTSNGRVFNELVCADVAGVDLKGPQDKDDKFKEMPDELKVSVTFTGKEDSPMEFTYPTK